MTLDNTGRKTVSGLQEIERRRGYVHTESLVRQGRKLRLNFSQTFDMRPLNYLFFSFHSTKNATSTDPQKIKRDIKKCVLYVVYDMDLSSKIWSPRRYETLSFSHQQTDFSFRVKTSNATCISRPREVHVSDPNMLNHY